jgi:SNF2 family DNA or RNA helicase
MFVLLRIPDVCDGGVNEKHAAKHTSCKAVSVMTKSCKPGCFQLRPQELEGKVPIPMTVLLLILSLAFQDKNHSLIQALLLISKSATTNIFVHEHLHGSSLTFRLELTLSSFVQCSDLGGVWTNRSIKKHIALPFTRFGVPLTTDLLRKLYSQEADVCVQSLIERVEAQSFESKHAIQAYLATRDADAYLAASQLAPFACPPMKFIDKTMSVGQPRLNVNLKHHQQHVVSWALWREKEGFVLDTTGVTWEGQYGLDKVFPRASNCRVRNIVSRIKEPRNSRGGMLLDEMGLGKTIEILAMIACDKSAHACALEAKPVRAKQVVAKVYPGFTAPFGAPEEKDLLRKLVSLVMHGSEDIVSDKGEIRGGTLIIAPSSLCSQWVDEIRSKLKCPDDYPVVKHYGSSRHSDLSRLQRSSNAVVVTTYDTLLADMRHVRKSQKDFINSCEWSCNRNMIISSLKTPVNFTATNAKEFQVIKYSSPAYTGKPAQYAVITKVDESGKIIHAVHVVLKHDRFNSISSMNNPSQLPGYAFFDAQYVGDLVVCTARNKGAYQCAQCGFDPTETLESYAEQSCSPALARVQWKRVVCDESHRLKASLECMRHLEMISTKRRWCLTGTPFPESDENKLVGQLAFLQVPMESYSTFKVDDQKHLLADIMVRHTKATVADVKVGSISHVVVQVDMSARERKKYDALAKQTEECVEALKAQDSLTASTRDVMAMLYKQRLACSLCSQEKFHKATNSQNHAARGTVQVDCPVCWETACPGFAPFECTHGVCYFCVQTLLEAGINKCPMCRNAISGVQVKEALKEAKAGIASHGRNSDGKREDDNHGDAAAAAPDENAWGDSKAKALLEYLSKRDVPTVVFTQFNECVDILDNVLREHGYNVYIVRGSMAESVRGKTITRFKSCHSKAVLLLTLRSASFGLNLTHASRLVHMDVALQEVQEKQANGRVHRQGQENDVEVCHLVCAGTVEENIADFRNAATMDVGEHTILSADGVDLIMESDKKKRQREMQLLGLIGSSSKKKPRRDS